jgi:polyphenol oxidase
METLALKALANDAMMTLRGSQRGFGFNLGLHVGDCVADVMERRAALERALSKPIFWVNQTHGTAVIEVGHQESLRKFGSISTSGHVDPSADALVTAQPDCALAIMTADCLPVIFRTADHGCVGIAHAGWRGLVNGVLDNTVLAMRQLQPNAKIVAQFGVAIGPDAWEVGRDVKEAFVATNPSAERCFRATGTAGKYWGDLYELACIRLAALNVKPPQEPRLCTFSDPTQFFSYRRDGLSSGRQATLVWRSS